ncbi:hypothetical protein GW933_04600 [Candidatus Falkowbacteria bacterium]|uniref:VanZ-like domain-containing protein n=1 Tax=Candidatus Buchananbacteria bacterium CG10_big_fil_rev_8_21_14_0_10_33_19 TaxID=1974525 RepID=A0A2H0W6Y2_9BACT|nr:hypothetical protein [Candidatus Falkowbacteria bacterium]PIS06390.1 MAG: hypothetical protein COT80_00395 [Candidatus Buchananbacteria bacterium CG10_big_fil_rev_8_21_14_0_10_33_19]
MEPLPKFDSPIQIFLRQQLVNQPYIYIDLWSLVHFCSGLILGFLFATYYHKKLSWLITLSLLIIYEILEVFLTGIVFVSETYTDKFWDLIIGMAGFFIFYKIFKKIHHS